MLKRMLVAGFLMACVTGFAQEDKPGVKEGIKSAGKEVGHAAKKAGKAVGHGARKVGKGFKEGGLAVGHGVRDAVKGN